jgi:hypothetical protein
MDALFLKGWALLKQLGIDKEVEEKARAAGKTPYQLWLETQKGQGEPLPTNVKELLKR